MSLDLRQARSAKLLVAICAIAGLICTLQDLKLYKAAPELVHRRLTVSDELYNPDKVALCIVTASYGDDEHSIDDTLDATKYAHPDVKFFFFTNSEASKKSVPGWTKIIKDLPYKSRIVQSRWAKFQAFHHEKIVEKCRTVMYMDACSKIDATMDELVSVAVVVRASEQGYAQAKHILKRKSISDEFEVIERVKKDTPEHVKASMKWLKSQPDFKDDVTIYQNNFFWYDYHNERVVEMLDFFWNRYSQELDSWRDQPLWAYTVHHFNFKPIILLRYMIGQDVGKMHNGHNGYGDTKKEKKPSSSSDEKVAVKK